MNRVLHLLADDPISEPGDDKLNRRIFAGQVIEVIRRLPAKESSTVLALIGPWGSGKSSLLGLVTKSLELYQSEEWKVVAFNPWELSSLDGLMLGFFEAISSAIPDEFKTKTVGETLQGYAGRLLTLGGAFKVPGAMLANAMGFADPGKLAEGLGKLLDSKVSTQALKKRLEAALAEMPQRLLVVIDDLDRLMPDELLMVFKLIRLLGRLSGVHYLLAYDEQTVLAVLKESQLARGSSDRALAYLEKIVQVRLDLPTVHRTQVLELIQSCVGELLSLPRKPVSEQERARLMVLLESDLLVRLNEPRSIKRFFAQVAAYLPLVVHRVDLPDFVALSYVRTFHPMLYRELHRRKRELLTPERPTESTGKQLDWTRISMEAGVPESEATTLVGLIGSIFPTGSVSSSHRNFLHGAAERRAANADYFDRYFYFGVPPGDVSEDELEAVVSRLRQAGAEADMARLELWLREKFDLVLPKLKALEAGLDGFQRAYLLIALAHKYREAHASGENLFKHYDFLELSMQVLTGVSEEAAEFVSQALADSTEIHFLFLLMRRLQAERREEALTGTGGQKLLLACAHRVPEILAAQTGQTLPKVPWCIGLASAWASVVGHEPVHHWMVSQMESGKTSWRVEDLVGCCVVGVEPLSEGLFGERYRVNLGPVLHQIDLFALVPRAWLLEKLKGRIEAATESAELRKGAIVPFESLINDGLWALHRMLLATEGAD
ncbi:KAP family P-loop NTPase fold protein [Corallococcus carmarthensis]|uniref:KAP family P-loop NTPase fold protein n=1 Tax=Corallococcus carmarthensis TaxID=2316728 RepID=UPI00148E3C58|nr:P-loop NTPase fold protein [Corallococcus carmarthensis]NOK17490.1 hypothetical protein [Corallococcus carmarthensis]